MSAKRMTPEELAKNQEFARQMWAQTLDHTAAGPLKMELVSVDEDEIVLRMPITDAARQPVGLLHGGVTMVLVETAGSMHSCFGLDLTKSVPVGIEINGSHLRSAREGHVIAKGHVIRRARTLIVHEVNVYHEETGAHLNVSRITNMIIAAPGA